MTTFLHIPKNYSTLPLFMRPLKNILTLTVCKLVRDIIPVLGKYLTIYSLISILSSLSNFNLQIKYYSQKRDFFSDLIYRGLTAKRGGCFKSLEFKV